MADGVQFLFELDAKAPGMDKLLAGLDKSNAQLKSSHHNLKGAEEGWRGVGGAVKEVTGKLREFEEAAGIALAIEGVKEMTESVMELGEEIVNTAAKTESLNFSMEVNFGKQGGKEIEEWAERLAKERPFSEEQIKGWGIELGHAGVAMKDLDKYMFAGLDAAARSADKTEGMTKAMEALRTLQLTGQVSGRQLKGLGLPVENFGFLPQFKGMTKSQIFRGLDTANLSADDVFRAMTGGKPIGELGAEMQNLLDTKLKNVKTLPEQFFEKTVDSPAFETFKGELGSVFDTLDPDGPIGAKIFSALDQSLTEVTDSIKQVDFKGVADDIVKGLELVPPTLKVIEEIASGIWEVFKGWAGAIEAVTELIPGGAVTAKSVPKSAAEQALDDKYLVQRQKLHEMKAAHAVGAFGADVGINSLNAATMGLVKGATDALPQVKDAGAALGKALHDGAAGPKGLDAHSPSKKFEQLGMWANEGFARGLRGTAGVVVDAVRGAVGVPARRAGGGGGALGGVHLSINGTQVHVTSHGEGRDAGTAAADGFMAAVEARVLALLERMTGQRGGG